MRDEVWRCAYLGMIQDGDGNCEHMAEQQLRSQVGGAAEVSSRKKMSLSGAICLSNVVVMPRVRCIDLSCLSSATADEQVARGRLIRSPNPPPTGDCEESTHHGCAHWRSLRWIWGVGGSVARWSWY
jgi:hypothetical protein